MHYYHHFGCYIVRTTGSIFYFSPLRFIAVFFIILAKLSNITECCKIMLFLSRKKRTVILYLESLGSRIRKFFAMVH